MLDGGWPFFRWDPEKVSREDAKARRRDRIRVLGVPASMCDKLCSVHMVFASAFSASLRDAFLSVGPGKSLALRRGGAEKK